MKGAEWSEVCGPQGCDSEGICLARKTEGRGAGSQRGSFEPIRLNFLEGPWGGMHFVGCRSPTRSDAGSSFAPASGFTCRSGPCLRMNMTLPASGPLACVCKPTPREAPLRACDGGGGAPSLSMLLCVFQRLLCAHRTRGGIYNFMDVHKKRL